MKVKKDVREWILTPTWTCQEAQHQRVPEQSWQHHKTGSCNKKLLKQRSLQTTDTSSWINCSAHCFLNMFAEPWLYLDKKCKRIRKRMQLTRVLCQMMCQQSREHPAAAVVLWRTNQYSEPAIVCLVRGQALNFMDSTEQRWYLQLKTLYSLTWGSNVPLLAPMLLQANVDMTLPKQEA